MTQNINARSLHSPGWRRVRRQDMRARVLWPTVRLIITLYLFEAVVVAVTLAGVR